MKKDNILKEYAENNVLQATPEGLILLLYNKCVSQLESAKYWMDKKNIEKTHSFIVKAQDILYYLQASLDTSYEVSKQFDNMYDFILSQLIKANIKKDMQALETALDYTVQMRTLWVEAMDASRQQRSQAV